MKIMVIYESRTGNVEAMARSVAEGIARAGVEPVLKEADQVRMEDLPKMDGFMVGCFTSYGQMSSGMSRFFEQSYAVHGQLEGKPAGAFASSGGLGGGNETTVLSLITALMVHGMIIQGNSESPHFGTVCIGTPDAEALEKCRNQGEQLAALVKKLK